METIVTKTPNPYYEYDEQARKRREEALERQVRMLAIDVGVARDRLAKAEEELKKAVGKYNETRASLPEALRSRYRKIEE